jgi:hypothetical protein
MSNTNNSKDRFVVTAFWEASPGEEEAVAAILSRFTPRKDTLHTAGKRVFD